MIDMLHDCGIRTVAESEKWFLVHTLPNGERKADAHLNAQGFKTYLPRIRKTVRHARQLKTILSPAFPRYLFIALDLDRDRWLSVRGTVGVARLFSHSDGRPVPVPAGVVEALIARSEGDVVRLDTALTKGQCVRILSGPLAEFRGALERLSDSGRVQVLLDIMGKAVPVTIHRSALSPAT